MIARVDAHRVEQRAVVRHEEQRAVVAVERGFELLDGGQVEMVRGLVEHQAVHALGREPGEHRTRAFAG